MSSVSVVGSVRSEAEACTFPEYDSEVSVETDVRRLTDSCVADEFSLNKHSYERVMLSNNS